MGVSFARADAGIGIISADHGNTGWHESAVSISLASDVQDGVGFIGILIRRLNRLACWKHEQSDLPTGGLLLHLFHHWQSTTTGTDHELRAFPRYLLFDRERCMAKSVAEWPGRLLLSLANRSAINHHVVFVGNTIDADRTK